MALQVLRSIDKKRRLIDELIRMIGEHRTVVLADIAGLRALQLQRLRSKLRETVKIKVAKNSLIRKAIEELEGKGLNLSSLKEFLEGQTAVIASNLNPFEVYNILERSKVNAKAKPGDIAPKDIVLPAGNTGLTPGPILSVFKKFKVPIKIEEGSIHITKDSVVVKAGETIPAEIADLLGKFGIEPMEIGLKVKVAYSDGLIFKLSDLKIDIEGYRRMLSDAASKALSLAINATFITTESAPYIIARAVMEAKSLAINTCYPTSETIGYILAKAQAQATALSNLVRGMIT
ncbi:MAG: 50S ribosomal protein L10 [Candidatus Nezhaarchaeota archaeon]|nr:50S ribosomal protein L10 [Candidatus Nezhaarchaeota archaeon]MCX8142104.1 50S ribosomal protein L10 [Candidatus Nezhaarchaeota archaeon]MDW8050115.1 50S ribosomal protein L10 [Nitrososphaerota archaeon]